MPHDTLYRITPGWAAAAVLALVVLVGLADPGSAHAANTTEIVDSTDDLFGDTSIVLDGAGNPAIAYEAKPGGLFQLKIARCGDPACATVDTTTYPDPGVHTGFEPDLVLDDADNPIVVYSDFIGELHVLHCGNPACDGGNSNEVVDGPFSGGLNASLALDEAGNPVVAYDQAIVEFTVENNLIKVLHCGNPNCSAGNSIVTLDSGKRMGEHPSMRLDADGSPVISYYDNLNHDLKVAHCGNPSCSSGNTVEIPDTGAGGAGAPTSLSLDPLGNPVVAYIGDDPHPLKILHCGNPSCSAGNTITTPLNNVPAFDFSLALDLEGHPVVAYSDGDALRVLRCGVPTCAFGNVITVVDTFQSGGSPSITIDGVGNPVITYTEYNGFTTKHLVLLTCGNPACAPDTDTDTDSIADWQDNCAAIANPAQENTDGNLIDTSPPRPDGADDGTRPLSDLDGDACDDDDDNDALDDDVESNIGPGGSQEAMCPSASGPTDPLAWDTDGDRVSDGAECALGFDPASAGSKPPMLVGPDQDADGLPDALEPPGCESTPDCDGDGLRDGLEFRGYNTDPQMTDSDLDGCSDAVEVFSVDGNAFVTAADLGIVASALGTPGTHANFDIDKNGGVSAADLGMLALRVGAAGVCS